VEVRVLSPTLDSRHDGDEIDEILVSGGRHPTCSVGLQGGSHLVGSMVDERIGPISVLLDVGNRNGSDWWYLVRLTGDPDL
jgi:hypothetical protein